MAHFELQAGDAVKKALQHRNRKTTRPYEAGDLVYAYREHKGRGKKWASKWIGPAVVIGAEGPNFWVARGGRCLLVAGEHLRPAEHEEVSEMLRFKAAMLETQKVIDHEFEEYVDEVAAQTDGQAFDMEFDADDVEMEEVPAQGKGLGRGVSNKPMSEDRLAKTLAL